VHLAYAVVSRGRSSPFSRSRTTTAASVADQLAHLAVASELHPRCAQHPVGEITGHVPVQVVVADDEVHRCCLPGQEAGCLAGGVAATDDRDRASRFGSIGPNWCLLLMDELLLRSRRASAASSTQRLRLPRTVTESRFPRRRADFRLMRPRLVRNAEGTFGQ